MTRVAKHPHLARIGLVAVALCLVVVTLGAYVRLSHAGLGCPDWPGCYGRITWPDQPAEIDRANAAFPERPVEIPKAWREMVHRFAAGALMLLVLYLALATNWHASARRWQIAAAPALVVAGTLAYTLGWALPGFALLAGAVALLMRGAWAWNDRPLARLAVLLFALILVQALFGKWTVTLKLKPVIVTTHLLGGMATFALLVWFTARAAGFAARDADGPARGAIALAIVVVAAQIFLGGWTSANYAALACGVDWPRCIGAWWPAMDFGEAFVLWRGIGVDYEGGVLDGPARTAIQMAHRLFAGVVVAAVGSLAWRTWRQPGYEGWGAALALLLALQVALGIANVVAGLPLAVATAHNGVAALLLGTLVVLLARRTAAVAQ